MTPLPGCRLQPMRWWDVAEVAALEQDLFADTPWSAEAFWGELARSDTRRYVVARDGEGRLLGYAGLLVAGAQGDVQTVAVAPVAQGRGLGAVLLRHLVAAARAAGCSALMLEVRADNVPAQRLYAGFGFERIAVRRRYYQPGDVDAWVMRLRPLGGAGGPGEQPPGGLGEQPPDGGAGVTLRS